LQKFEVNIQQQTAFRESRTHRIKISLLIEKAGLDLHGGWRKKTMQLENT